MIIKKGTELENMSAMTDDRLTLLNIATKNPKNEKQIFIQRRIHAEIAKRCREVAHVES